MTLPLRTRLFWSVSKALEFRPAMQQPAERVRKASNLRQRLLASPPMKAATWRTHRAAAAENTTMTLDDGTVLVLRVHRPKAAATEALPIVVNFHGGGWVSGDVYQSEWWASSTAAEASTIVVSVAYRLAPEHPFPTAVEDCYAALVWVHEHAAQLGGDPARMAVMGDSAGGNLAAVVSMLARDRSGPAIALQLLVYPSVDFVGDYPSELENAKAPILSSKDVDNVPELYFHGTDADRSQPTASPIRGKHEGLPPAVIQTAQYDPLRDQGYAYAAALRAAGVVVRHTNYVGAVHGYMSLPGICPNARQSLGELLDALRDTFPR